MIVLDTSALLFWTLDPAQLSENSRQAIEQTDQIAISSISVWEIAIKVKRRKLELPLSPREYAERLGRIGKLEILSVDVQNWLDNLDLPWEHHDPADRTIVALATRLGCPLITSDRVIASYYRQTIW